MLVQPSVYGDDNAAMLDALAAGGPGFRAVAVTQPDGYIKIRDRSKDIIISGGENISSIEVEKAVSAHPDVLEAAVVGAPDPRWNDEQIATLKRIRGRDFEVVKMGPLVTR